MYGMDPLHIEPKFDKINTVKIIQLYRAHPVLWDVKDKNYRRQDMKIRAYCDIAKKMHMSVEAAKKKIKSLRSTYTGEKRKMFLSKNKPGAEEYITSLSWFSEMSFLNNYTCIRKPVEVIYEEPSENSDDCGGNETCDLNQMCEVKLEILKPAKPKENRTLSTQVLDTSKGKGAAKVPIMLYRLTEDEQWHELTIGITNENGYTEQLLDNKDFQSGIYKLKFDVYKYFISQGKTCFFPFIEIVVKCVAGKHYHIPVQVNQFSYSVCKGSE